MAAVVYLCSDLLFTSKIREVARQVGVEVAGARDVPQLLEAVQSARLVILDLRRPDALDALGQLPASVAKVGFVDHERTEVMDAARARECQPFTKGKFSTELPAILVSALTP